MINFSKNEDVLMYIISSNDMQIILYYLDMLSEKISNSLRNKDAYLTLMDFIKYLKDSEVRRNV